MTQAIIFTNDNGGVATCIPTGEISIEAVMEKDVPKGRGARIVNMTDLPNHKCPKTYHPNGYVDLIRAERVKRGQLWGPEKQAFITPRVIEIDTEEDFERAEWWLERRKNTA